jgi:hypothetical protein
MSFPIYLKLVNYIDSWYCNVLSIFYKHLIIQKALPILSEYLSKVEPVLKHLFSKFNNEVQTIPPDSIQSILKSVQSSFQLKLEKNDSNQMIETFLKRLNFPTQVADSVPSEWIFQ